MSAASAVVLGGTLDANESRTCFVYNLLLRPGVVWCINEFVFLIRSYQKAEKENEDIVLELNHKFNTMSYYRPV